MEEISSAPVSQLQSRGRPESLDIYDDYIHQHTRRPTSRERINTPPSVISASEQSGIKFGEYYRHTSQWLRQLREKDAEIERLQALLDAGPSLARSSTSSRKSESDFIKQGLTNNGSLASTPRSSTPLVPPETFNSPPTDSESAWVPIDQHRELESNLKESQEKNDRLGRELQQMKSDSVQKTREYQKQVHSLEQKLWKSDNRIIELGKQCREEREQASGRVMALKTDNSQLKEQLNKQQTVIKDLEESVRKLLRHVHDTSDGMIDSDDPAVAALQRELKAARHAHSNCRDVIAKYKLEAANLRTDLRQARFQLEDYQAPMEEEKRRGGEGDGSAGAELAAMVSQSVAAHISLEILCISASSFHG